MMTQVDHDIRKEQKSDRQQDQCFLALIRLTPILHRLPRRAPFFEKPIKS